MRKKALITGITGQDGSYLAELLLEKGYEVHGLVRRNSNQTYSSFVSELFDNYSVHLHYGDLTDNSTIVNILSDVRPDEIYNLASQSHVKLSYSNIVYTSTVNSLAVCNLIEALRTLGLIDKVKIYQASSSEMYGNTLVSPQDEKTKFSPVSPYGVSKLHAHLMIKIYREMYGMFGCNGILYNHESPRRSEDFVTRKITKNLSKIKFGKKIEPLELGNLDSKRDWGHAKDYVNAMWLMLQHDTPNDYVISSGTQHSVREFVEISCQCIGFDIEWVGNGINEIGIIKGTDQILIKINPQFYRPIEVNTLVGNPKFSKIQLGWKPKYSFYDMIQEMCEYDMSSYKVKYIN